MPLVTLAGHGSQNQDSILAPPLLSGVGNASHRAISPPTPAPSPQPEHRSLRQAGSGRIASAHGVALRSADAAEEMRKEVTQEYPSQSLSKHFVDSFPHLDARSRLAFLTHLIDFCTPRELAHLSSLISPRLKVDFLAALPIEVSLHIISFLDDPKTLARASAVSRFWRSLVNDEQTWKVMCLKYRYRDYASRLITHTSPSLSSSAAAATYGLDTPEQSFERSPGRIGDQLQGTRRGDGRRRRSSSIDSAMSSPTISSDASETRSEDEDGSGRDGHEMGRNAINEEDYATFLSSSTPTVPSGSSHSSASKSVLERLLDSYMARGLDAASALSELRTIHELFLTKRARQVNVEERRRQLHALQSGSADLLQAPLPRIEATSMSDEDRRFYEELEDAVREGRSTLGLDHSDGVVDDSAHRFSLSASGEAGPSSAASSSLQTSTAAGWLSSTKTPRTPSAPRIGGSETSRNGAPPPRLGALASPRTSNPLPSSIISPTGRLSNVTSGLLHSLWDRGASRTTSRQDVVDEDENESMDVDGEGGFDPYFSTTAPSSRFEGRIVEDEPDSQQSSSQQHVQAPRSEGKLRAQAINSSVSRVIGESSTLPIRSSRRHRLRNSPSSSLGRPPAAFLEQAESSSSSSIPTLESLGIGQPPMAHPNHTQGQHQMRAATFAEGQGLASSSMDVDALGFSSTATSTASASGQKRSASATYARPHDPTSSNTATLNFSSSASSSFPIDSMTGHRRREGQRKPFSYKMHFKLAYMTENNWLRGGRLLTQHVSSDTAADAGSVVTSLSIDDEWIIVGMANAKIHVFDVKTGLFVRTLEGHSSGVWCLSLVSACKRACQTSAQHPAPQSPTLSGSAHGASFSTAAHEGPSTGPFTSPYDTNRPLYTPTPDLNLVHHDPRPTASAFSPDIAVGSFMSDDLPTMSRSRSGEVGAASFKGGQRHTSTLRGLLSSQSGRVKGESVSSPAQDTAGHWAQEQSRDAGDVHDMEDKTYKRRGAGLGSNFGSPCGSVSGFGNEGAIVVSGGCDRDIRVWDVTTGKCLHVLRGHNSTVRCLRVLEGRPLAISGSRDSTVRVWNIETGQLVHLLSGHLHSVRCLDVAGNRVVSASYDSTCRIWDIDTGECLHVLRGHYHQIYAIAFDGVHVATGSLDSTVRVWSAETGECLAVFQGHTSLVGQLQLNDNILITGGSDGKIIVFSLDTYTTIHQLLAHENSVTCLQFDDRFIVTGGNDGRVKLWNFRTGEFIRELSEPGEQVWKVSFRDDKCIVLCRRNERTAMDVISFRPVEEAIA